MPTERRVERVKEVASRRHKDVVLVLEDVHDPHNAQAVFRSCDAFGVQEVHLIFHEQEPFNPRHIGKASSSSANKWLDFHIHHDPQSCIQTLKARGFTICATALEGAEKTIYKADFRSGALALLLGNENRGLSETALANADRHLAIPMEGMVGSLNISVTAAVFLFELNRQRRETGLQRLSSAEQDALVQSFLQR
ncbi:MAG: RNA methyltransferase [Candidatus Hydrogenedentota bacterium]